MQRAPSVQRAQPAPVPGYVTAPLHALKSIPTVVVELHVKYDPQSPPVLFCQAGWQPDLLRLEKLEAAGVSELWVRNRDFNAFSSHLLQSLDSLLQKEDVPQTEKFAFLQMAVAAEVEHAFRTIDCSKYCIMAERIGQNLVDLLAGSDVLPSDLFRIARHDFNTFTHVTNVASYSVILAERLGVTDRGELNKIAFGAMLHDVGKRFIPAKILTKPGRLTNEERSIVEAHPRRGYEELCVRSDLNVGQLMMVYQHHERVDGGGYPVGVLADEIHPWAQLLAVVDVFDAITATRPYRQPVTRQVALDYQQKRAGSHFDFEIMQCWISAMTLA